MAPAAELLWAARQSGQPIAGLPKEFRPADIEAGWAIARAVDDLAGPPIGWKIAGSSAAGRRHIAVDEPLVGPLYSSGLHRSGAALPLTAMASAEPEFAFVLGAPLLARDLSYGTGEILDVVAELRPAIELPDTRYADFASAGAAQLVADGACTGMLVVGDAITDWSASRLPAWGVSLAINGTIVSTGRGGNALGDPCEALAWVVNAITCRGVDVAAGQVIITGACTEPCETRPGDSVVARFADAPLVEVSISGL